MTRLRMKLKENHQVNREALDAKKEIISTQEAEETGQADVNEEEKEKGSLLNRFAATITKIVVPALAL